MLSPRLRQDFGKEAYRILIGKVSDLNFIESSHDKASLAISVSQRFLVKYLIGN